MPLYSKNNYFLEINLLLDKTSAAYWQRSVFILYRIKFMLYG